MKHFALALQFLTIAPLPKRWEFSDDDMGRCTIFFPVVGLILGAVLWGIHSLFSLCPDGVSRFIESFVIVSLMVVLTRGLHLDGFADSLDGFLGGMDRESTLRIMRDSSIGAYGAVGIVLLILGKWLVLKSILETQYAGPVLLAFPAVSRWGMVALAFLSHYARPDGTGRAFVSRVGKLQFWCATALALSVVLSLSRIWGGAVFLGSALIILVVKKYSSWRIGGVTGDVLGAANEILEVAVISIYLIVFTARRLT
ncbi:MAG: adenosylcobinamide-GDP ribazoletransferase [bacterium]